MRDPEFWQAFLSLGLSGSRARELLQSLGRACATADALAQSHALTASDKARLKKLKPLTPAQRGLLRTISLEDDGYPENLRTLSSPPVAFFINGKLAPEDSQSVAVIGTRKASAYGRAVARKLAMEIARAGITVVSGAAHGIDAEAHKGALLAGGRTIAVLGSGLDRPYPASHRSLLDDVARSGAVISQFPLGTSPDRWNFPLRNYTIAGLAKAVIVVEAPENSGSLLTATIAVDEGRHVFVTPGTIDSVEYRGSFKLINDGATLLYSPDQVFEALGVEKRAAPGPMPKLSSIQADILGKLSFNPELADNLSESLGKPAGLVLSELTKLELEGLVAKAAGGYVKL